MDKVQQIESANPDICSGRRLKPQMLFVSNLFPDASSPYLGLDNAILLHQLRDFVDVRVICPRPSLRIPAVFRAASVKLMPREIDMVFHPHFIEVPYVPLFGSLFNHRLMKMRLRNIISRILRKNAIDIIVCSWLYPDGCAVSSIAQEHGVPVVLITQGTDTHQYINKPARRDFILDAVEKSGAVIARSAELARLLETAGVDSDKLYPVHNGVDRSIFYPRDRELCRQQLGVARDLRVIIFVGNFLPIKNPEFLLKAFSSSRISDKVILAMIGKGPMRSRLVRMARNLGIGDRVVFTGPLDPENVGRWMGIADCLCLASHNEGLPNVVIESLASGLPVVAPDVGGIGELVNNPELGTLVPVGDIRGYISAMVRQLKDTDARTQTALNGLVSSWRECAEKHARIIDYVLNVKHASLRDADQCADDVSSLPRAQ
ncbi:MAG: glycosyltransferase [Verrucomicrobiales bacterium]